MTVQDLACAPVEGAAVYLWHCDSGGNYLLYSTGITDQNYLRGIQATDADGVVTFTSIYPACYSGRRPHIHSEVYSSVAEATSGSGTIRKTSQLAMPEGSDREVYATTGYSASVTSLSQITLATDNVFGDDDAARELATVTGDATTGYAASLVVTIDPTAAESGGGTAPVGGTPPTTTPTTSPSPSVPATSSPVATPTPTILTAPIKHPGTRGRHHRRWWPFR